MSDQSPAAGSAATTYRDEWAESLSDATLDYGITSRRDDLRSAMNTVTELRYELDRLEREKDRRANA